MSTATAALFIIISAIAVSYGWGMRGTTIGGEKGAMLPGAIMGIMIAVFSGIPAFSEYFVYLTALGSLGMYFGGCMTYGETLGLSMNERPAEDMKRGLIALFVKGFLWFGVFGAVLSLGLTVLTGKYFTGREIISLFLMMPVFMIMFMFIFNRPLNAEKNVFPKIYFSKTRKESWGAMLGLLSELVTVAVIKKLWFPVKYTLICAVFGAVGWVVAQLLQIYARQYSRDSGSAFIKSWGGRRFDAWKLMECVLGMFGGIGAALGVVLLYDDFSSIGMSWLLNGINNPFPAFCKAGIYVWAVILLLDMAVYYIPPLQKNKKFKTFWEVSEYPIYAAFPLMLVFLGDINTAVTASFFILYIVIIQETCFGRLENLKFLPECRVLLSLFGAFLFAAGIVWREGLGINVALILYGVFYETVTLAWLLPKVSDVRRNREKTESLGEFLKSTSLLSVHTYFIVCIAVMTVAVIISQLRS